MSRPSKDAPARAAPEPIWTQPPPGRRRPRYTREQIAEAALRIADAEGFEAVSMRRVAAELAAGTMTLYHYVRTKDDLRALMDDAMMREILVPAGELPDDWREAIAGIARRSRAVFRRHPWARTMRESSEAGGPNGLRHFEQSLAAVAGTGLDAKERLQIIAMVDDYVFGFAMRESHVHDPPSLDDVPDALFEYLERQLATGAYPHIEELAAGGKPREVFARIMAAMSDEQRFERGLQRLLDGIALDVERRVKPSGKRR
jgi:AcrR family transcriptional regulator